MQRHGIRPIALCLFSHQGRILVFEERDAVKGDCFARPLGGGIEFGETSLEAIQREIQEELGQEITGIEAVATLENIFTYNGNIGHEIVFLYDARFVNEELYDQSGLDGFEHEVNLAFKAVWRSPEELREMGIRLVPEGLEALLERKAEGQTI